MIGGLDIIIPAKDTPELRLLVLQYIKSKWPDGCVEVEGQDHFFYKDAASQAAWEKEGGTDQNQDTMIYIIYEPEELTLVISHFDGAQTYHMAEELRRRLIAG